MTAIFIGLLCAALIGIANFFGGIASKKDSSLTIAFVGQITTVPVMAIVLAIVPADHLRATDILWGLAAGLFQIIGLRLIWHALSIGKMGLLAAITATMAAIAPTVWAVISGETLTALGVLGAALALVAILLMVYSSGESTAILQHRKNALMAAGAGTCFGIAYIGLAVPAKAASVVPLLASRSSGALLGAMLITKAGGKYWLSKGNAIGLAPGLFGVASLVGFVVASHLHVVATVSIVQGLAPLFTALLAFTVLRQKLRPVQAAGLVAAVASTVLLSIR